MTKIGLISLKGSSQIIQSKVFGGFRNGSQSHQMVAEMDFVLILRLLKVVSEGK
jgi:hypothetical protein